MRKYNNATGVIKCGAHMIVNLKQNNKVVSSGGINYGAGSKFPTAL